MKGILKKTICAALIVLLLFSLAACSDSSNGNGASTPNPSNTTSESDSNSEPEPNTSTPATSEGTEDEPSTTLDNESSTYPTFDFEAKTVMLNSGYEMPILGLGVFQLSDSECENSVYHALLDGYRLIDTARIYGNEAAVGRGIVRSGVPMEEVFITTKIWTADFGNAAAAIDASLERLGVEYIDLMLLHHEGPNDEEAYRAMEEAVAAGKIRSIGISNFYEEGFERIMEMATITPAVVQNETHPYNQSVAMKEFLAEYGTVMESWFPLGGRGNTQVLFDDDTISSIAAAHDKTSAQVILRWHLQAGNIAIPGSRNPDHILENYEIFDFALSDSEMEQMTALDKEQRFSGY